MRNFPSRWRSGLTLAALAILACLAGAPARADEAKDDWRAADAAIDRNLLVPTAQTLGQGEVSLSDYEIVGLGVSYGATDSLEASFTTFVPFVEPMFAGAVSAKARVWSNRVATVSAQVALEYAYNTYGTHVLTPALFGLVDLHTPDGLLLWSTSLGVAQPFAFGGGWAGRNTDRPLWSAATGPLVRVHPNIRLLVNLAALGGFGEVHPASDPHGDGLTVEAVVAYGVRFSGPMLALDLGAVRYLGYQGRSWILGFPIGSFTVRF